MLMAPVGAVAADKEHDYGENTPDLGVELVPAELAFVLAAAVAERRQPPY